MQNCKCEYLGLANDFTTVSASFFFFVSQSHFIPPSLYDTPKKLMQNMGEKNPSYLLYAQSYTVHEIAQCPFYCHSLTPAQTLKSPIQYSRNIFMECNDKYNTKDRSNAYIPDSWSAGNYFCMV